VTARYLPRTPDLEHLADDLLDRLQEAVSFDRASFSRLCEPDQIEIMSVRPRDHPPEPGSRFALKDVLGSQAVRANLVVEVDLGDFSEALDRALYEQGYRHALRVPIGSGSEAPAALAVQSKEPFTREDIDAVAALAAEAGERVMSLSTVAEV